MLYTPLNYSNRGSSDLNGNQLMLIQSSDYHHSINSAYDKFHNTFHHHLHSDALAEELQSNSLVVCYLECAMRAGSVRSTINGSSEVNNSLIPIQKCVLYDTRSNEIRYVEYFCLYHNQELVSIRRRDHSITARSLAKCLPLSDDVDIDPSLRSRIVGRLAKGECLFGLPI